jgi:hypothetical protein
MTAALQNDGLPNRMLADPQKGASDRLYLHQLDALVPALCTEADSPHVHHKEWLKVKLQKIQCQVWITDLPLIIGWLMDVIFEPGSGSVAGEMSRWVAFQC